MARAVGITEFLIGDIRIGGILKQKPADFIVQEVDLKKNIAKLTNEIFIQPEAPSEAVVLNESSIEELKKCIGQELSDKLFHLSQEIIAGNYESILEIPSPEDKMERTIIHQSIKKYAPMLTSSTEIKTNTIKIYSSKLAQSHNKRQKLGLDSRGAKQQPAKFVKFILYKENTDTMKAVKEISKATGIKEKSFGLAGNKDKKALTTQYVTVFANYLEKLQQAKLPQYIKIGNFQYTDKELKIGDLYGNKFEILISNIQDISQEKLNSSIEKLKTIGFVNYFGLQRFGNSADNSTHSIGLAIITKNYSQAVDLILGPRSVNNPDERLAREN